MSISNIDPSKIYEVTSETVAHAVGVGPEWIRQLSDDGTLEIMRKDARVRIYDLFESIRAYCEFLRNSSLGETQIRKEMALAMAEADLRYKEARAGKIELELAELKGQMHRAEDVELVVSDMIAKIRAAILALPGRLAVDTAEAKTARETSALIKTAVDELLNETAAYKYDAKEYRKLVMEREKWLTLKEAETAKKEETKQQKKTSKRQSTTSKASERASKPRKT